MITLGQIFKWIVKNRKRTAFEYSDDILINGLSKCVEDNSILTIVDDFENIQGVVCWKLNVRDKKMFVMDILTTKDGVVKTMMKRFHQLFPGYTIEGVTRNKRPRHFNNTVKLYNRL